MGEKFGCGPTDDVTDDGDPAGLGLSAGSVFSLSDGSDPAMHQLDCDKAQPRPGRDIFCFPSTIPLTDTHIFIVLQGEGLTRDTGSNIS